MSELIKKHLLFIIALIAHLLVSLTMCVLSWISWSNETGVGSDAEERKTKCLWNAIAWSVSLVVMLLFVYLTFYTQLLSNNYSQVSKTD